MYDFQRKHGHDIDCHVLAPASTCSNKRASTCSTTRASMVLNGASTCSNTCASTCITTRASTCITTRASTCHYTRARLLFKNMHPGWQDGTILGPGVSKQIVGTSYQHFGEHRYWALH